MKSLPLLKIIVFNSVSVAISVSGMFNAPKYCKELFTSFVVLSRSQYLGYSWPGECTRAEQKLKKE